MTKHQVTIPVWLCSKKKFIQSAGLEGILSFNGADFVYVSSDKSERIHISESELQIADLNNIMGSSQFILKIDGGHSYVFTVARPVSNLDVLKRILYKNRLPGDSSAIGNLSSAIHNATIWRQVLVDALPADKVKVRKEVRPGFIVIMTIAVIFVIAAVFVILISVSTN